MRQEMPHNLTQTSKGRSIFSIFSRSALLQLFTALLAINFTNLLTKPVSAACTNSKNYCSSGVFSSEFKYDYENFNIRYEWEMFEGSIALSQHGLFWKEITDESSKRIHRRGNSNEKVTEMVRIRKVWHFKNQKASYDDTRNDLESTNDANQYVHANPAPRHGHDFFVGDVVPFQSCAYIVNLNIDKNSKTKYYTFERYLMNIEYDGTLERKITQSGSDYFVTFTENQGTSINWQDFPEYHIEFNFMPMWGSFFYLQHNYIYLLTDNTYDRTDTCLNDACDQHVIEDVCDRDKKMFIDSGTGATGTLSHYRYNVRNAYGSFNNANWSRITSLAMAFDSLFFVETKHQTRVYRLAGPDAGNLVISQFYIVGQTGGTPSVNLISPTVVSGSIPGKNIRSMCSMDYYGIFIGLDNGNKMIRLEPQISPDPGNPGTATVPNSAGGQIDFSSVSYYEMDVKDEVTGPNASAYRLLQTRGFLSRHRPCYLVTQNVPQQLQRITTEVNVFFPADYSAVTNNIKAADLFNKDYLEPQILRFHMMSTMPGIVDDTDLTGNNVDYDFAKAVIFDLRHKDVVLKWPLQHCGDGYLNTTMFEECEHKQFPPTNDLYFQHSGKTGLNDLQVTQTTGTQAGTHPNAYPRSDTSFGSGKDYITYIAGKAHANGEYGTGGYYYCNNICLLEEYKGCGDGVPTNGPITREDQKDLDLTQQQGDFTFEICDDGNTNDNDGCKGDCSAVEPGYECLEWGQPCTPQCGNGHIEAVIDPALGITPVLNAFYTAAELVFTNIAVDIAVPGTLQTEQCDMGGHNSASVGSADYHWNACDKNCQITDNNFWQCKYQYVSKPTRNEPNRNVFISVCDYMCGNQVLDLALGETCDIGAWAFTGEHPDGYVLNGIYSAGAPPATLNNNYATVQSNYDDNDITNFSRILGCTSECQEFVDTAAGIKFECPDDVYGKCTHRCGDGIMDGPIVYNGVTVQSERATNRKVNNDPEIWVNTHSFITGIGATYTPSGAGGYDFKNRIVTEQCDNGGDHDHGCDKMCQIVDNTGKSGHPNWSCTHYYHWLEWETPLLTSNCVVSSWQSRRRLKGTDFDNEGRLLNHLPRPAYFYKLPQNDHGMRTGLQSVKFDAKSGTNGQFRFFCSTNNEELYGFTFVNQPDSVVTADYLYIYAKDIDTSAVGDSALTGSSSTGKTTNLVMGSLYGKQRNTFGQYLVTNADYYTFEVFGYVITDATTQKYQSLFTSTKEESVELMGSHEVYWFPYKAMLLTRLADGSSFKLNRLAANFQSAQLTATKTQDMIQQTQYRLFHVPNRVMIPPAFHNKLAAFIASDMDMTVKPWLYIYEWNDLTGEFDKKCDAENDSLEISQSLYHQSALISVGADGFLAQIRGGAAGGGNDITLIKCDPVPANGLVKSAVTVDVGSTSATVDTAQLTLLQVRADPDSWVTDQVGQIYGVQDSANLYQMSWDGTKLVIDALIAYPPALIGVFTASAEHMDVGAKHIALMAPVDCAAVKDTSFIGNASVWVYTISTTVWACHDLPVTDNTGASWSLPNPV